MAAADRILFVVQAHIQSGYTQPAGDSAPGVTAAQQTWAPPGAMANGAVHDAAAQPQPPGDPHAQAGDASWSEQAGPSHADHKRQQAAAEADPATFANGFNH